MAYQKFSASHLFTGSELLSGDNVLVMAEDGSVTDIVTRENAGEDVQAFEGIITPGFINAHCHLELSHLKGQLSKNTGLVNFVLELMQKRYQPDQIILSAIEQGEKEMLAQGIVAVGDICNNSMTIAQKKLKNLHYYNFIEVSGVVDVFAKERFDKGEPVIQRIYSSSFRYR